MIHRLIFAVLLLAGSLSATTNQYYVNSATGSDSNSAASVLNSGGSVAWATIQHAVGSFSLGTAGATIHVAPGTYGGTGGQSCYGGEGPSICISRGGTSTTAMLTLQCDGAWTVPSSTAGCHLTSTSNTTLAIGNANYIEISGGFDLSGANIDQAIIFGCDGNNPTTATGVCPSGNGLIFEGLYIHDVGQTDGCPSSGALVGGPSHGSSAYNSPPPIIRFNRFQHIGDLSLARKNGGTCNQYHAVYFDGPGAVIQANLFLDVVSFSIHAYSYPCSTVVVNNTIVRDGASGDTLSGGDCSALGRSAGLMTHTNNISIDAGQYGYTFDAGSHPSSCTSGTPNLNSNNMGGGNPDGDYGTPPLDACTTAVNAADSTGAALFVNYLGSASTPNGNDDLHLKAGSPAIGAGTTGCVPGGTMPCGPSVDFDGNPMPNPPSIGAYTFVGSGSPVVSLSPTSLAFGSQSVGVTSASQAVTLKNIGTSSLAISSIAASGDFGQTNNCPASLGWSLLCTINVTFTPTVLGARSGNVAITDNASGSPQTVPLTGTGVSSAATVTPSTLAFGSETVGTPTAAQFVTVLSSGTTNLNLSNVTITGSNASDFLFAGVGTCSEPSSIPPNSSCTISILFSPTATGSRTATLSVIDDAATSPQLVSLTGTGGSAAPAVSLTPSTLTFAQQLVGTTSTGQSVTLTNTGTGQLNITSIGISGDYANSTTCGVSLAANASCSITATFTPTATGSRTGTLTVTDNASGSPHTVALSGTGIAPTASISPSSVTFGSITVGQTSTASTVTLTNTGTAPLQNIAISLTGTNPGDFSQTNTCQSSSTFSDTFSTGTLDSSKWVIDTGNSPAPGPGNTGTFSAANVGLSQGMLALELTQVAGSPIISTGAEVRSINTFGFGTYAAVMRASSTATTPNGSGFEKSGSVSSPFIFINNSQTEIDWPEFEGQGSPGLTGCPTVGSVCAEWTNFNGISNSTNTNTLVSTADTAFHTYKMVWSASEIDFYVDGSLVTVHTTNIPSAPAYIIFNHYGTNSSSFGGVATTGVTRWQYISSISYAPTTSSLPPNSSCTVSVQFSPTAAGSRTANLQFVDSATNSPQTVALSGTGVAAAPVASISPSSLTFPSTTVGVTSSSQNATLTNTGTATLNIASIVATGDYAISAQTCGSTLSATSSCTVSVTFTPTTTGTRTGTLSFTDNASGSPQSVALTGTGTAPTAPIATITPSSLTFANQVINTTSSAQVVTLNNTGNATLNITSKTATGDFAISATTCGSTLAASASCTVSITFTPTALGTRTGALTFVDNAAGSPQSVPLTGTGVSAPVPIASISPSSLTYGNQVVNTTSSFQNVTLQNTGTAALAISSIATTANFGQSNNCPASLGLNLSCTVQVTFTPSALGTRNGTLSFTDNANGSPQTVSLTGVGVSAPAPIATINPTSLTFSSTTVGVPSAAQVVTLQNTGNASLSITSISATGDYSTTATCGASLAANASCTVSVTFTPTTTGTRTGVLSFTDNASGSPQAVSLTGTGTAPTAPIATISPSSLTFGSTTVGVTSASQAIMLQNTGNATLNIGSITVSGDFAISSTTCGSTLTATSSCTINITFTPTATGSRAGTLTFVDNAAGSPQTVGLTGTGTAPTAPIASISPSSLTFGNQVINTNSPTQPVTLKNTGNATLNIASIMSSGDFSSTTTCGSTLAASASCTVNVLFTPTALGTRTGTLTFVDNATGSPQTIALSGTGVPAPQPIATVSASSLTFPSTTVGVASSSLPITLQNTGNASLAISSIVATGDFSQTNNCGASLAASATCTVNVVFTPTATGTRTGLLSFTDNASGSPQTVSLQGTGTAPTAPIATISPSSLSFSAQIINTTSSSQAVSLQNTGNATLNISSITVSGDFAISSKTCSTTLASSAICAVNITFTPTATGTRSGVLTFTDNAAGSPQTVTLSGQGVPAPQPIATISPSSLSFANQTVGTTSASRDVTLQNTGNAVLNIASIATTGDFGKTTTCGSTLAANASCLVHVTFTPTASGPRTGTVSFTDNASGSPQAAALSGTGLAAFPSVSLSMTSLNLGSQQSGTTSPSQSVIITNNGTGLLTFSSITITGTNAADYSLTNGCGGTLAAGSNCTLSVTFTPSSTGTRTAAISIADDAADSPQTVSLTGVGTPAPAPQVSLNPASLTFASQATGTSSSAQIITMQNTGDASLSSIVITLTGSNSGDYGFTTTCGSTLASTATCTISVTFTPTAGGTRTANVNIADNASDSPQTVALSGTGFVPTPAVTLSTTMLTFASQSVGTSSNPQSITVTNSGTGTLTFSSIAVSGDYSQTNNCGASLSAGLSCAVNVTFAPTAAGTRSGTLAITDNASGSPHTASLSGLGQAAVGSASPSSLLFGNQGIGSSSVAQIVTLSNSGNVGENAVITFTGANPGDFSQSNPCSNIVPPGGNCLVSVTFTPSATGTRSATMVVTSNATNSPQTVTLSGTGVQASLSISPTTLAFGSQPTGTVSSQLSTLLTNVGTSSLTMTSIAITGPNSSEFAFASSGNCAVNTPLAPNASCPIRIQFQPVTIGSKSASITIVDNAPGSPHTVALTGTGTSVILTLSQTSISFGNQAIGTTSSPQTSTLTNIGTANEVISSIGLGGGGNPGDYSASNNCPSTLIPLAFCTITARFAPTTTGTRTATVNIVGTVNATLPLTGSGTRPATLFSPTSVAFGNQTVGNTSSPQTVTLTNTGLATLNIGSVLLTSTNYAQTNNCGSSLAPSASCHFNITFTPGAAGETNAILKVTSNSPTSPDSVSLTGAGILSTLTLTPSTFNFGSQAVGTTSGVSVFTVNNTGAGTVAIVSVTIVGTNASDFAVVSQNCVGTLDAQATCSISITFTPTSPGLRQASINVASNAQGSPQLSASMGTGVNATGFPAFSVSGPINFGGNLEIGVHP